MPKTPPIGSVSSGTLRKEDLIPAFLAVLQEYDYATYSQITMSSGISRIPAYARDDEYSSWWDSKDAYFLMESLFDALQEIAPEGCYFGSHEGDGADFGFWPSEDDLGFDVLDDTDPAMIQAGPEPPETE